MVKMVVANGYDFGFVGGFRNVLAKSSYGLELDWVRR